MNYSTELQGEFQGWNCSPSLGLLFDPAGNAYHLDEIRAIFFNRQLIKTLCGVPHDPGITTLKRHLERKIELLTPPRVSVVWGDGTASELSHSSQS